MSMTLRLPPEDKKSVETVQEVELSLLGFAKDLECSTLSNAEACAVEG
ncbi:hypothetical protein ACFXCZ_01790 [Streptomyces sp. NPDC059396]